MHHYCAAADYRKEDKVMKRTLTLAAAALALLPAVAMSGATAAKAAAPSE